jgi:FkbM family methyltransferase
MKKNNPINRCISKLIGDSNLQRLLEKNVIYSQSLMGIGSGSTPNSSGERKIFDLLKNFPHSNEEFTIFDVGANKGQFMDLIRYELYKIPHIIHAFEPSSSAFSYLSDKFKGIPNIFLNNIGLGKSKKESTLYYDKQGSGLASLYKRKLDYLNIFFDYSEKVQIETLDSYCKRRNIQRVDLLKLDVEGHELDVLHGSISMLTENRIQFISFEFGGCNVDSRTYFKDFYYFFKEFNMKKIYRVCPTDYLYPINTYKEIYEQFRTTNFVVSFV